ncbi:hypothetical protein RclHR1_05470003 [Rhizophagus clarus]|uniref:DDE-1 domain-containing protein n=1 Tax=Rhizophagus clarus TaxID=94130 RepID=A0A2Z6S5Q6_9GLOM|nr:hypothetical protein RclHR1_05470003 [Rhizophagus clarus]GES83851.1 hypothetical protein GLOIN_2v1767945 [Rhizophagus clarus]
MELHCLFLVDLFTQHCTAAMPQDIPRYVNSCQLFQLPSYFTSYWDLSPTHPCYLLFHNFILLEITQLFNIFITKSKLRKSLLLKFLCSLFNDFKKQIWNIHASALKQWESTQFNITSKSKRS